MSDLVAELDRWLTEDRRFLSHAGLLERARDEIVALRSIARGEGEQARDIRHMLRDARAEALEEAARESDNTADAGMGERPYDYYKGCLDCAAAIRALK